MTHPERLPDTGLLTLEGDPAGEMVAGIDRFLTQELEAAGRHRKWGRDSTSHAAYEASVAPNRERLRQMLGLVDARLFSEVQVVSPAGVGAAEIARGDGYGVFEVRWAVLEGLDGEGLLLVPDGGPSAMVVALPDCDVSPEQAVGLAPGGPEGAQFVRRLAENGCGVLVPQLLDRGNPHSGHPRVRKTNQPHREFVYRAAYELGRHVIGYELQIVLAAVDAFSREGRPVGVFGHGEGGLLAFYAAAVDTRIQAAAVSGYFGPREGLWEEPIYRNLFGLLREFGDAEIAGLIAPRALVVEAAAHPEVAGPPPPAPGQSGGAAPGRLRTPPVSEVRAEWMRARKLTGALRPGVPFSFVVSGDGSGPPGTGATVKGFLMDLTGTEDVRPPGPPPARIREGGDPDARLKRHFDRMVERTQYDLREAEYRRADYWTGADFSSLERWVAEAQAYRDRLWQDVIGPLPPVSCVPNPRTRLLYETPDVTAYEVMLDVFPEVFAYGVLLLPEGMAAGERRPVVVCQHGLEGRPGPLVDPEEDHRAYHQYGYRLAQRGFVVYAPQNPYIGGDAFRVLQRKANPLKLSLFSFIVRQHEQTLAWLGTLPFVDAARVGFYGLSYGGKTAMRIPALVPGYCLSICSADFNEWIWKNASARHRYSYVFTGEYEMFEFNLGNTFNYAEMSWLICPRPFMVERGHHDGVAPDEWVAYEYARTRRQYTMLGVGDRTEIEFFDGPHTIHGEGTFAFLHRHLNWSAGDARVATAE